MQRGTRPTEATDTLAALLAELLELSQTVTPASLRYPVEQARSRLVEGRINVVVLGEFKRGKTSLVNALLERDLLPTGVVPVTSVVTLVRHGENERVLAVHENRTREEHPLASLPDLVTEAGNPHNVRGIEAVVVEMRNALLMEGMQLVDTPGVGSVFEHNTEIAEEFFPHVDAAIVVLTADQPVSSRERDLVREAVARTRATIFVLNKVDHLAGHERVQALEFVSTVLAPVAGAEPEILETSVRSGEGIDELRTRIHVLATDERKPLLIESVRLVSHALVREASRLAALEASALLLPLDQLARRVEEFSQRTAELKREREDASELVRHNLGRALARQVEEPLAEWADANSGRLVAELRGVAQKAGPVSPRCLAETLGRWIDTIVSDEISSLASTTEAAVADELAALEERHLYRIRAILDEVGAAARETFGVYALGALPEIRLTRPAAFTFKLHDEEQALEQLLRVGRDVLPGPLGRRLALRDAERRLVQLADRHAGRLRHDLVQRAIASVEDYDRRLGFVVEEAVGAIAAAAERAAREQRSSRLHAQRRLDELDRLKGRLQEIAAGLEDDERAAAVR
jgi:small GTP-binding protein